MNKNIENNSFFSETCINQCKGMCCDPWWGIIAFTVIKKDGFSRMNSFKNDVIKEIRARAERIRERYVTNEVSPRRLFKEPERYNVKVEDVKFKGQSIVISLRAMFAFRCLFLSEDKTCAIHPAALEGNDIRPQHCGFMGSIDARLGEKGYCRIIHAAGASSDDANALASAIAFERDVSERCFNEGAASIEKAGEAVIEEVKSYFFKHTGHFMPATNKESPGRNEPCFCGSGKKYKKCHGQ